MRDWKRYVGENLPSGRFKGEMGPEIQEEIANHLEDTYSEALERGATEAEAEALTRAEVADWERLAAHIVRTRKGAPSSQATERLEASEARLRKRGGPWINFADLLQELRFTFRRLRKAPAFTAVVLLTLGIGIGATTAIFSVVKGVLLDPLPYADADQLVAVWNSAPGLGEEILPQSLSFNAVYEDEARVFEDVGAYQVQTVPVFIGDGPQDISALAVTDGILPALRVQPTLGRTFTREEVERGSPLTVILSHSYWVNRMNGDPGVLGQALQINGNPWEIIGVLPQGFRVLDHDPELYLPLRYTRATLNVTNFIFFSLARLREGVTLEEALDDMARVIPMAPERYPGGMTVDQLQEVGGIPVLHPLKDELVGGVKDILWVVLGGVGIILLVACANVANLLMVRAEGRERALAVQSALGSPRGRVVGQCLTESITLSLLGGLLGVGIAHAGIRALRTFGPSELPRLHEIGLDGGVLLVALVLSVFSGVLLGLLPLVRSWRVNLVEALKEGGRGFSAGRERARARNTLVVVQLGLALVLLVGSGLMIRSFIALRGLHPGYSAPEEILTFRLTLGAAEIPEQDDVAGAHERMAQEIGEIPGVVSVGLSSSVPMQGASGFDPVFVEDFPLPEGQGAQIRRFKWIGGGYHEALGNPVLAGRPISWVDIRERTRVVMITESIAREFWGEPARAIGRRISTGYGPGDWREVIGVVGNVWDDGMERGPVDIVFWPMVLENYWAEVRGDALFTQRTLTYVVRSPRVGTPGFSEELKNAVQSSYPSRPLGSLRTLESRQRESMARTSFTLVMLGIAAAVALLLGGIGIYGVISYTVAQRTREIGLRIAMGAEAGTVTGMVLRQGLVLSVIGVGVGLGGAFGATRLMEAILFGVSPVDPVTFALVPVCLVVVALLASYLPARRAAQVDPMVALRTE